MTQHETASNQETRESILSGFGEARATYQQVVRDLMEKALNAPDGALTATERFGYGITGSKQVVDQLRTMEEAVKQLVGQPIIAFTGEKFNRKSSGILGIIGSGPVARYSKDNPIHRFSVPVLDSVRWFNDGAVRTGDTLVPIDIAEINTYPDLSDQGNEDVDLNSGPIIRFVFTDFIKNNRVVLGTETVYRQAKDMPTGAQKVFRMLPSDDRF